MTTSRCGPTSDIRGQSHETQVAVESGDTWQVLAQRFHETHQVRNGFSRPDQPIELVTLRAAAISRPALEWSSLPLAIEEGEPRLGQPCRPGRSARSNAGGVPLCAPGPRSSDRRSSRKRNPLPGSATAERAVVLEDGTLEITW